MAVTKTKFVLTNSCWAWGGGCLGVWLICQCHTIEENWSFPFPAATNRKHVLSQGQDFVPTSLLPLRPGFEHAALVSVSSSVYQSWMCGKCCFLVVIHNPWLLQSFISILCIISWSLRDVIRTSYLRMSTANSSTPCILFCCRSLC